jgi:hypothetical protein
VTIVAVLVSITGGGGGESGRLNRLMHLLSFCSGWSCDWIIDGMHYLMNWSSDSTCTFSKLTSCRGSLFSFAIVMHGLPSWFNAFMTGAVLLLCESGWKSRLDMLSTFSFIDDIMLFCWRGRLFARVWMNMPIDWEIALVLAAVICKLQKGRRLDNA